LDNDKRQGEKGNITRGNNVIFIESLRLGWYGHVERMQNQRMPKQIATAKVE
jgi:hypothetical protein